MDKGCSKVKKLFRFENDCHKRNFIITLCVYFNFILLGWTYGQLGTAFVDLQQILSTSVQQTSLIFTMNSCGYMLGTLLIGALYDRVPTLKLLGLLTLLNGITSAVLTWCSSFGLFLFVRLVDGMLCGGRDGGGNAKVSSCWGFAVRPYMQALHFTYAFGGIISPIVTSHFLAPRITLSNQTTNISYGNYTNASTFLQLTKQLLNYNTMVDERAENSLTANVTEKWDTFNNSNSTLDEIVVYGESHVHIAFVVTGILTALSGCLYLVLYGFGFETVPSYRPTVESPPQNDTKDQGALGFLIDPLYIGYLMEHSSPLYLIYINVIQYS
ncbi:uncharacterized protein LOC128210563 [Mya arenaria]|uniref:uncharacterized protein LOC128210563 n=1 Tax=Mya arenaria TaxID=6604 RepID=UPI0022E6E154|nr:uncharacterized protein LOC128210563 [Mya arenaria]